MMDNDENEVNELMNIFIKMAPVMLKEILEYMKDENWPECGNIAHKLKSSTGLWEINILDDDILYVEEHGRKSENTDELVTRIIRITQVLKEVTDQMKEEVKLSI
ncbi:MAG: Hpt domain-containing protein [Bacteroidales bacterium]|nr:Hpt domain-containing protein [Bacteroidales bacterium]